jgi:hypothetical protein
MKYWGRSALLSTILATITPLALADDATEANDVRKAESIIDKGIEALGGAAKLDKLKTLRIRCTSTRYSGTERVSSTEETTWQDPDRSRSRIECEIDGKKATVIFVTHGKKGWISNDGATRDMSNEECSEFSEAYYTHRLESLYPLKSKGFKLEIAGVDKVEGRPVEAVKVSSDGHRDVVLFFDKDSGLLLKSQRWLKVPGGLANCESLFGEYKKVDGLMIPFRYTILHQGVKSLEIEATEITTPDKVNEDLFEKP